MKHTLSMFCECLLECFVSEYCLHECFQNTLIATSKRKQKHSNSISWTSFKVALKLFFRKDGSTRPHRVRCLRPGPSAFLCSGFPKNHENFAQLERSCGTVSGSHEASEAGVGQAAKIQNQPGRCVAAGRGDKSSDHGHNQALPELVGGLPSWNAIFNWICEASWLPWTNIIRTEDEEPPSRVFRCNQTPEAAGPEADVYAAECDKYSSERMQLADKTEAKAGAADEVARKHLDWTGDPRLHQILPGEKPNAGRHGTARIDSLQGLLRRR